jgi:hypothetical protein
LLFSRHVAWRGVAWHGSSGHACKEPKEARHLRACFSRSLALRSSSKRASITGERLIGGSCTAPLLQQSVPRHPVPPSRSFPGGTRTASPAQSSAAQCVQTRSVDVQTRDFRALLSAPPCPHKCATRSRQIRSANNAGKRWGGEARVRPQVISADSDGKSQVPLSRPRLSGRKNHPWAGCWCGWWWFVGVRLLWVDK